MNVKSQQKTIKKLESELNIISQENETLQKRLKDSQIKQKDKNNRIEALEIQKKGYFYNDIDRRTGIFFLDYVEKMGEITNQIGEERAREKQREVGNMLLERIDAMLSRSRDNPSSSGSRTFEKQLEKRKSAVSKFVADPNPS